MVLGPLSIDLKGFQNLWGLRNSGRLGADVYNLNGPVKKKAHEDFPRGLFYQIETSLKFERDPEGKIGHTITELGVSTKIVRKEVPAPDKRGGTEIAAVAGTVIVTIIIG